ncbi:hypothetical protein EON79_21055 [bacterium]|nr:MAG: hypothetical protein EON79_21055 [bacterium]
MTTLTVPNWSIYAPEAEPHWERLIAPCTVHYCQGDPDHGRTVTAFSGPWAEVEAALFRLAEDILPRIDLRTQTGVHPRIGALDVCPFVGPNDAAGFAERFGARFDVPTVLYERSDTAGSSLPAIRNAGRDAPATRWGVTTVGERGFLVAMNVDLAVDDLPLARRVAREIRTRREAGEPGFAGVRALGFALPSRGIVQVSMNLTDPDRSLPDDLVRFVEARAPIAGTELIGVIRERDLPGATRLPIAPAQVVDGTPC